GFTGSLVAAYLAAHAPAGTRWALAGRDAGRLGALRDRLGVDVPVHTADVTDPATLRRLARRTRVVATTVPPYVRYGESLVAARRPEGARHPRPARLRPRPGVGVPAADHRPADRAAVGARAGPVRTGLLLQPLRRGAQPAGPGRPRRRLGRGLHPRADLADPGAAAAAAPVRRRPGPAAAG